MTEVLSYAEPNELFVRDGQFDYEGARYHGNGWMRWNPETGARINLSADRVRPAPQGLVTHGMHTGWLRPEHYTTIRMTISGFDWVLAPHVGLVDRLDMLFGSYLSVDAKRLVWRDSWPSGRSSALSGHVTLAFHERTGLFTPLRETAYVGDRKVLERHSAGESILAEVDGVEIFGRLDAKHRARIGWTASDSTIVRKSSWAFGYALRAALSLCAGCSASVLERQVARAGRTYRELQSYREPSRLVGLEWFLPGAGPTSTECLTLALAFLSNPKLQRMSWGVFSQLLDSYNQRSWGSSELLVALILEGILRTLDNRPFVSGKKYELQEPLMRLRQSFFPSITKKDCRRALEAQKRLRHHNAHPDWLSTEGRLTYQSLTQSSDDMAYLSRFYGRVIFEVAGLPELAHRVSL